MYYHERLIKLCLSLSVYLYSKARIPEESGHYLLWFEYTDGTHELKHDVVSTKVQYFTKFHDYCIEFNMLFNLAEYLVSPMLLPPQRRLRSFVGWFV